MKSRISFDVVDLNGQGLEPVIRVKLNPSDHPMDKMVKCLFQSLKDGKLEVTYTNNEREETEDGYPQFKSTIILHSPKN